MLKRPDVNGAIVDGTLVSQTMWFLHNHRIVYTDCHNNRQSRDRENLGLRKTAPNITFIKFKSYRRQYIGMKKRLADLMRGFEKQFPQQLVERFPRIAHQIVHLWTKPEALKAYLKEIMIMDDHHRQGFPKEIASEIFRLSLVYDEIHAAYVATGGNDAWHHVEKQAITDLDNLGLPFTPATLFKCVSSGDTHAIELFFQGGMEVDTRDPAERTPLMCAAFYGLEEIALLLIKFGADMNARDAEGYTPMHWAALCGYAAIVKLLLGMGIDPNVGSRLGFTPLLQAAARGHLEVVNLLLDNGADPNRETVDGWTPLHKTVANRHRDVVAALLAHGANPHAKHRSGLTPIMIAKEKRFAEILQLLNTPTTVACKKR